MGKHGEKLRDPGGMRHLDGKYKNFDNNSNSFSAFKNGF